MRAGDLDRVLQLQRINIVSTDAYGTKGPHWVTFATMRAQKLENALTNREGARGDTTDNTITFRTRFIDGVKLDTRLVFEGRPFKITNIKEIGRRHGMDITCERVGP